MKTAYIEKMIARCDSCGAPWNALEPKCEYCGVLQIVMPKEAAAMTWLYNQDRITEADARMLGRPGKAIPITLFGDEKVSDVVMAVPSGYTERDRQHHMAVARLRSRKLWNETTDLTNLKAH